MLIVAAPTTGWPSNSIHQLGGDRRAKVPARLDVGLGRLAHHHDRLRSPQPSESGGDAVDSALGSLGALVAVEVDAEWSATGGVEQLIVGLVEGVLESARDVAEVGRGAQQVA